MLGSEYGEQDKKATVLYEYETFKATEGELLLDTYIRYLQVINDFKKCGCSKDNCELNFKFLNNLQPEWKQYATMMRQYKNLMDINIDALYNILKQNQRDVNDAMGSKKKTVVVTSDPLALVAEKTNVSKQKEKVVVSSDFDGSGADDFSKLNKITALLVKAFNQRKFYSKPTNNNLRTSSTSQSANKKQEFVKTDNKKVKKKTEDQAWMESRNDSDQEINANMVFMAQIEKVLSDSEASSSSDDEKISEGLFMNNDDDQEIFHDAIEFASENFIENHIDSQKDYDKSDVDHNDSQEKDYLIDKLIRKFNKKIVKCQKRIEKAKQQSKDFENQNKDLQDKYDILKNQATILEMNNKELNEQLKELIENNNDLLAQTKVLKEKLQVKLVVIDTHVECQEKYTKLKAERYEYMIRYSAYFDNDKQHRKQIADQEVLYDKISFESSETVISESENQSENDCLVVEKECNKVENSNVIDPGMFKLNVSQSVSPISIFRHFSSVRRPKNSGVIWKKKGLSNTFNVDLSA
nr:Gag-Pol polyprotein [Tanacetum cinerariifolium]